ncbi:MAG: AMP-binding protein, partial [Pseudomonadota bacterium]
MDGKPGIFQPEPGPASAGRTTVGSLFRDRARVDGDALAVIEDERRLTYAELNQRVNRLAHVLAGEGVRRGDRVAILSRNCTAYLETELAAAKLGAIVAAQNWRLAAPELAHCMRLAEPRLLLVGPDHAADVAGLDPAPCIITLDEDYEDRLARAPGHEPPDVAEPEDGLLILYTSGTTGMPKGAVVSHRAMIARALVYVTDAHLAADDGFVAWAPFFHMVSTDHALAALLRGGVVIVIDGYRPDQLIDAIVHWALGWFVLIPGMIEPFLGVLRERGV